MSILTSSALLCVVYAERCPNVCDFGRLCPSRRENDEVAYSAKAFRAAQAGREHA